MSYDKSAISSTPPWLQQPPRDDAGTDDPAARAAGRHTDHEPNDDADAAAAVGRGTGHRPPPPSWLAGSPDPTPAQDARTDGDVADATRWVTTPAPQPQVPGGHDRHDGGPTEGTAPPQPDPGVAPAQGFGPPPGAPTQPPSTPPPWAAPDADRGTAQTPPAPWGQTFAPPQFAGPPQQFDGPPHQDGPPPFQGPPAQFGGPQQFETPQQFEAPQQFETPQQFEAPQQFGAPAPFDGPPPFQGAPPQFGGQPRFDPAPPPGSQHFDGPAPYQGPPQQADHQPRSGPPQQFDSPRQFEAPQQGPAPEPPANPWPAPPVTNGGPPPISPASDPFAAPGGFAPSGPPPGYAPPGYAPNGYGAPQTDHHPNGHGQPAPSGYGQSGFTHTTPGDGPYPPANGTASLDQVALLRKARRAPNSGWRRAVHRMSAGAINPGDSPDDLIHNQLIERVNRPVRGDYRIAVLSLKGGVGKTTTTVGLGSVFASLRGDRVIAVDANPDLGTLAQRIPQQTRSTVRDLLADNSIYRYSDVRAHTSQAPSRLEVLASERDPAVAEAFSEDDYRGVMKVLQRFYNIIITDCGTGLSHSAMNGVLDLANALILVSSPAIDGARSAGATLDWLQAHGYGHLVSRAVVVLSSSRSGASTIDTNQLSQHFLTRCRAVQSIPFDDHLAEGAEVDLDLLGKGAHRAFVELAATVADDFSATNLRRAEPYLR
ncbi:MinD/ParA family ATP-binding protein [Williamsia herbipolensis]|uniref:MinD/ParA family ATP-binding protein n=1 Tax=Williamsia herbipolensis TaxID=1603258 RepID=UPI001EEFFBED|nr:MinD/ParA family protein [Williamsia herbipolensis]